MKGRCVCFIVLAFTCLSLRASEKDILIRLFASNNIYSFVFAPSSGQYAVYGDNTKLFDADNTSFITVTLSGSLVQVQKNDSIKKFSRIRFIPSDENADFKITSLQPNHKYRLYDDELHVSALQKTLFLVNKVNIEKYVSGVIQWEVGKTNPLEFNKVKAIAIRTYALGNWKRHELENVQLCDEVHCQVFKGKTFVPSLLQATGETAEYILVDDSARIIMAAFHANCGGQTMNSEDVWTKEVICLRSVNDTFCIHKANTVWQKKIPKDIWFDYLRVKYRFPVNDTNETKKVLHYEQPYRSAYLLKENYFIPLKFIREDMKLRSTFFTISEEGGNVVFSGKGYGHGVGLCQEGAMQMAAQGYSYSRILNYYYSKVHLIRYSQLSFFQSE